MHMNWIFRASTKFNPLSKIKLAKYFRSCSLNHDQCKDSEILRNIYNAIKVHEGILRLHITASTQLDMDLANGAIAASKSIKTLSILLKKCNADSENSLISQIRQSKSITSVRMTGQMDHTNIIDALKDMPHINSLHIKFWHYREMDALVRVLKSRSFAEVSLEVRIPPAAILVDSFLVTLRHLSKSDSTVALNIRSEDSSPQTMKLVLAALKQIPRLKVEFANFTKEQSDMAEFIRDNVNLRQLTFVGAAIQSSDHSVIDEVFKLPNLESLALGRSLHKIDENSGCFLAKSIETNTVIKNLKFYFYQVSVVENMLQFIPSLIFVS
jgi:hypothetical protein